MIHNTTKYDNLTQNNQSYLLLATEVKEIDGAKLRAVSDVNTQVENATKITDIYTIFEGVKNNKKGVLRRHRENVIHTYGDTDSYKLAIGAIKTKIKALFLSSDNITFAEYSLIDEVEKEAIRIGNPMQIDYARCKAFAHSAFQLELGEQKTLNGVLNLYQQISAEHNILRRHLKNVIWSYGDTDTYKKALSEIAKKVVNFDPVTEADINTLKCIRSDVYAQVSAFSSSKWDKILIALDYHFKKYEPAHVSKDKVNPMSYYLHLTK